MRVLTAVLLLQAGAGLNPGRFSRLGVISNGLEGLHAAQAAFGARMMDSPGGKPVVKSFFDVDVPVGVSTEAVQHAAQAVNHAALIDRYGCICFLLRWCSGRGERSSRSHP